MYSITFIFFSIIINENQSYLMGNIFSM